MHVFTVSSLGSFVDMPRFYTFGVVNASIAFYAEKDMKTCPSCRASLRNIQPYSRIIRRVVPNESSKRLIVWSLHNYLLREAEFIRIQEILLGCHDPGLCAGAYSA